MTARDMVGHPCPALPPVTGDQGLRPAGADDPGAIVAIGPVGEKRQQIGRQAGHVTGDNDDTVAVVRQRVEGRVDAADRPETRDPVGHDDHGLVGEARGVVRNDEQRRGHPLQDLHLSNDDGASLDDEATLVLTAESAGTSARHDGGGRRRRTHEPIMTEVHIGRLVAASLHQAISEELPDRLEFYENWLDAEGLRDGTIGKAPMLAVLGFLRTEGFAYDRVVDRAGTLAAEWSLMSFSPLRQRVIRWLPRRQRVRMALRVAGEIAATAGTRSRCIVRSRGKAAQMHVASSVFCSVRGVQASPLCGFYASLAVATLGHFGLNAVAHVEQCRAMGASECLIDLVLDAVRPVAGTAVAA